LNEATFLGNVAAMSRFYWLVKGEIAGSSLPRTEVEINAWREANIQAVISLVERKLKFNGFTTLHLPVRDMTTPSIAQLDAACAFIDRARLARAPVVVHCLEGKGRTGTVLAAWLISKGMQVADAMALVRALSPGSIETPEQEAVLVEFAPEAF
jgi:atypical dual specificity phosphatase